MDAGRIFVRVEGNALPVVQVAVALGHLGAEVEGVAGEEEVVLGLDGEGVAHEGGGVDGQGTGHLARDAGDMLAVVVGFGFDWVHPGGG